MNIYLYYLSKKKKKKKNKYTGSILAEGYTRVLKLQMNDKVMLDMAINQSSLAQYMAVC